MISTSDYYPFGSQMPQRSFVPTEYDYGFNGQEKDDDVKGTGNSLDFGARIYDPRIGRWLAVDPLRAIYPSMSPYSFAGNSPMVLKDPDGKIITDANGNVLYTTVGNPQFTYYKDGTRLQKTTVLIYANDGTPITAYLYEIQEPFEDERRVKDPENGGYKKNDDGTYQMENFTNYRTASNSKEQSYDCHGLTFANGEFWINNPQVDQILEHDGYGEAVADKENADIVLFIENQYDPNVPERASTYEHSGIINEDGTINNKHGKNAHKKAEDENDVKTAYSDETEYYKKPKNRKIDDSKLLKTKKKHGSNGKRQLSKKQMQKILDKIESDSKANPNTGS